MRSLSSLTKPVRRRISTLGRGASAGRSNTRARPASGVTMPSSTLIVVVLPAPFLPRNPKIEPAGTWSVRPRIACTSAQVLCKSTTSTTGTSATLISCFRFRQPGELRLEQPADLVLGHAAVAQPFDGGGDDRLRGAKLVGGFLRARVRRHEGAGAVPQLDHALVLELAVCLGDRVGVDDELFRQRPDARQLLAGPERAGLDGVLHLLHQLEVDGNAGGRVGADDHGHCATELVQ